jgi:predicted ABC-type ATPase
MRVIAGPNGSGKSTILRELDPAWVGVYVNADDLQVQLARIGQVDLLDCYSIRASDGLAGRLDHALRSSRLLEREGLTGVADAARLDGAMLSIPNARVNAYVAAVLSDFIRRELFAAGESFTFETVMSSPDKVDFMREVRQGGYRTYLYFVATSDPSINVERVQVRVDQGGHPVREDRIRERYVKSIALLARACAEADRAYIFDNSGEQHQWIAEITANDEMESKVETVPVWFAGTELYRSFQQAG